MNERYIGLMSGTSMDAIDAVLVDLDPGVQLVATHSEPLPDDLRQRLLALCRSGPDEIERLGRMDVEMGRLFARAALAVLHRAGVPAASVRAIGSHGQTVRHRPQGEMPFTLQIGDPNTIAERTGIAVVADFRRRDMAAGGQGAPLVPAFHAGLFGHPSRHRIVLNLGGSLSGSPTGALVLIIASMSWAFGSAWSRKQDMPSGPMNTAVQMLCASVALLVTGAVTGEHLPSHPTVHATLALAYLVVFGSLIAFSAYLYLLRHARPAVASSYAYVNPPVAVLFDALLANEHVRLLDVAGMGIILAGVATITLARTRRRPR